LTPKARTFYFWAAIALASFIIPPVGAASAQGTEQERSACEGDAFRLCFTHIPDVPAIEACLEAKEAELSPACRAEFLPAKKTKLRREQFRT
jgi:hypothetical protein